MIKIISYSSCVRNVLSGRLFRLFYLAIFPVVLYGQNPCDLPLNFTPSTQNKTINWGQFPEFSLPFEICYGGPHYDGQPTALKYGFSHVSETVANIPIGKRALIYYGVAYPVRNQPWEILRSPWGNDNELYEQKWRNDHRQFVNTTTPEGKPIINIDWFVFDIERQIKSNDSILLLRQQPSTPPQVRNLPNDAFVLAYKTELQNLYYQPINVFKEQGLFTNKLASYGDTPILNTFTNIQGHSWAAWQTDKSLLNANVVDLNANRVGGAFYDAQTLLMPSAYYYFDYPSPFAPEYLSYLLFQIEVNKAWSDKPIYPFVWLKYSANPALRNQFIRPWMAEATAIFPFFSGASGLWLWEDPTTFNLDLNFGAYEHFVKGLYRLSQFKDFFTGNYELVIEESAHELNRKRGAVWRGVVQGNNILVTAHNPFARSADDETVVQVKYRNWSRFITLKGYEVFLCSFDMQVLAEEPDFSNLDVIAYPNPVQEQLNIRFDALQNARGVLTFFNSAGSKISEQTIDIKAGQNEVVTQVPPITSSFFFLQLRIDNVTKTIKISTF